MLLFSNGPFEFHPTKIDQVTSFLSVDSSTQIKEKIESFPDCCKQFRIMETGINFLQKRRHMANCLYCCNIHLIKI